MEDFGLDFDSLAIQAVKNLKVTKIISYDGYFDEVPSIEKLEPRRLL